jgi:hypothetical protein
MYSCAAVTTSAAGEALKKPASSMSKPAVPLRPSTAA